MNNSDIIITLCSFLCVPADVKPLEPSEWSVLAERLIALKLQPIDMLGFSSDDFKLKLNFDEASIARIKRLLDRRGSLSFEISKYSNLGIKIITRADEGFPKRLKARLGKISPPLFYYAGDLEIANDEFIGFVGSRTVDNEDVEFTKKLVKNVVLNKYSIVSGGAKGIDSISTRQALESGGVAMEILSDSILKKLKDPFANQAIRNGRLLIFSAAKPDACFNAGMAMARNKYIYTSSSATVVIRSENNKGGTWSGALESLKKGWVETYCWDNPKYEGNKQLIKKGAIPIANEAWNPNQIKALKTQQPPSLFDLIDNNNNN